MVMTKKIGAHVSIAGGIDKAVVRAQQLGANCLQVFSGSPRMWKRTPLEKINLDKLFTKQKELGVSPIFTHALYLINLASDKPELIKKSATALIHDLKFDALVKGSGVIVHLGSHQGRGWHTVKNQLVKLIKKVLAATPQASQLLIENSAGQKGKVCSDLAEISWLLNQVDDPRLGWCFDTCHAFTAGYRLYAGHKIAVKEPAQDRGVAINKIKELKLWPTLKCVHVNDSKFEFGSGRDRHANLGEGQINKKAWKSFFAHDQVKSLPLILEVPGFDNQGPDAENLARLKELAT
ncbi:MAG: deoxyribonuclease IV [Candidatus Pacebacteria bacterium]|nr:deoxyribonuclease IV [Candidatus Paceibacterota bacterium]